MDITRESSGNSAFTLVEVSLATGLVALALIPMIGLMAIGMDSDREARSRTVSALIASDLVGVLQEADWETIETWRVAGSYELSYNLEGQPLAPDGGSQDNSSFTARLVFPVENSPPTPFNVSALVLVSDLPGVLGSEAIDRYTTDPSTAHSVRVYPALAVRLER